MYKIITKKWVQCFFMLFILLLSTSATYAAEYSDKIILGHYCEFSQGTLNRAVNAMQHGSSNCANLLQINDTSIKEMYLKLKGVSLVPSSITSSFYLTDDVVNNIVHDKYATGILYGFFLALTVYHLFLYFSVKDKTYLYYVLIIGSFILYQAMLQILAMESMKSCWLCSKAIVVSVHFLFIFILLFAIQFLELKRYVPRYYQLAKGLMVGALLSLIIRLVMFNETIINPFTSILVTIFLLFGGVLVLLKGQVVARFYIAGYTILLIALTSQTLCSHLFKCDVLVIGVLFNTLFLAFALGDKINLIKKEHQKLHDTLSETLESKVQQRTRELEKAKEELEKLANTDRLTQISNRVYLEGVLEEHFQLAEQQNIPFSIILLDIDNFKAVNDEFGHQVGDTTLIKVAQILNNTIREKDIVGRWGGEEFLVLCPQTMLDEAVQIAENLRQQLAIYPFPILQHKTGSFGVASYIKGEDLDSLLARSDKALYKAKNCGRNCVEFVAIRESENIRISLFDE
ncbi:diguanylate cyclase [Bacillus ndiopicus]|uniref:diguanylate cyclase n=1 Tax=Bacillus ndiopicus TaxID=1347368 RepID=UPI000A722F74|nr:diguanylate cyclase [Bacillus ndiopicus]